MGKRKRDGAEGSAPPEPSATALVARPAPRQAGALQAPSAHGAALTSAQLEAVDRLAGLSEEQLRAASPRELVEMLREAGRQQARLQDLAASLVQLQERAALALEEKLPP